MSCLGPCYNPVPTREWSRFQNTCSFSFNNSATISPITPLQLANNYKGNILQYKKNSSNLTKQQIYTQIAKGNWTNRTTTWATQSDTYTNPNTNNLTRVNNTLLCYGRGTTCKPTSNSDVPGPIINLCYNDTQQTYYPKTRVTYLAGSNKWPVNSKNIVAANQSCPVITGS
jgi:hypothetical protein